LHYLCRLKVTLWLHALQGSHWEQLFVQEEEHAVVLEQHLDYLLLIRTGELAKPGLERSETAHTVLGRFVRKLGLRLHIFAFRDVFFDLINAFQEEFFQLTAL
jgi:predicted RNA-binding protein associated with RNAse of E/G family